jgi:hypothetical protein
MCGDSAALCDGSCEVEAANTRSPSNARLIDQRQLVKLTTFRIVLFAPAIALIGIPDSRAQAPSSYELRTLPAGATLHRVNATPAEYKGRKAIKVEMPDAAIKAQLGIDVDMPTFVHIPADFRNGTIECDVLSRLNGKGPPDARAFIGISYRITDPEAHFETIYLRPLNGRKKNPPSPRDKRAVQYFAYPDWKFDRLRKEYPDGHYEGGADIADDEWITLRLDIDGTRVRVSVNGKDELALADAKGTPVAGGIGLWVGMGTEGYFSDLRITPR